MPKLVRENVDCFNYQYNTCAKKKCPFQHRECARSNNVICTTWRLQKHCRNKQCTEKHLDKEAMKCFFNCANERPGSCNNVMCQNYHEKPRSTTVNGVGIYIMPNEVPVKKKSKLRKKTHAKLKKTEDNYLIKSSNAFIEASLQFIQFNIKRGKLTKEKGNCYMKEILHSIFFIGYISFPRVYPEMVLREDLHALLSRRFPNVFHAYRTALPTRTPYSLLLDVVVETTEPSESTEHAFEYAVLDKILDLNKKMYVPRLQDDGKVCRNAFLLVSTVVSYCYFLDLVTHQETKKYFGTSLGCRGQKQREIFLDLSCLHTWNRNVAYAVCLAANNGPSVLLPKFVHSAAFHMLGCKDNRGPEDLLPEFEQLTLDQPSQDSSEHSSSREGTDVDAPQSLEREMSSPQLANPSSNTELIVFQYTPKPPCLRCMELFPGMQFSPEPISQPPPYWEHGNCAECESLSKLLNAEIGLNMRVQLPLQFDLWLPANLPFHPVQPHEMLLLPRKQRLINNLRDVRFELQDCLQFYNSQLDEESTALVPFQPSSNTE
ncbi:uncharacterized protein LOC125717853 isoform X2 [Brienomyrus brachyistius]|uniref:uncharacterized protein LOC125717853 isoform X2 n=1 Tax=Brienomyrus brachyistius TaxID=42636 RepID=UPI0020B32F04|nr:uncharacterized protein LOC125717853 isoform X2 [Brienomyrus brachyistius]